MKTNSFNICPTCRFRESCVLTHQKSQVWSCSEYEETIPESFQKPEISSETIKECQPEMVMAYH